MEGSQQPARPLNWLLRCWRLLPAWRLACVDSLPLMQYVVSSQAHLQAAKCTLAALHCHSLPACRLLRTGSSMSLVSMHLTSQHIQQVSNSNGHVLAGLQEGNLHPQDLSSTEGYQRDSFPQFIA